MSTYTIDWPYLLPSLRDGAAMHRFHGAVKTRILQRQKALWSRFIGAGFVAEDIKAVWPDNGNVEYFGMKYSEHMQHFRLSDLNLRELDELDKWLNEKLPMLGKVNHEP